MVHCVRYGLKNMDDAKVFTQYEASSYSAGEREHYRRIDDECFGIPRGGSIVSLVLGIMIILVGLSFLIQEVYGIAIPWWPFMIILFGMLIIIGAIYSSRRSY